MKKILEPIWYIEDNNNLHKYDTISFAEINIEAVGLQPDIDIFIDSSFRKLKVLQKDKYGRVKFELTSDTKSYKDTIDKYIKKDYKIKAINKKDKDTISLDILMKDFKSEEWQYENSNSIFHDLFIWFKTKFK